jgi:hypothetical protein
MSATGLVIEIASESCDDDELKIKRFKESPNWKFYLNACRSYGFSVDASTPWRLVADIGSSEMIQYARNTPGCNYLSTDSVLALVYTPAHTTYYENFRSILLDMYNRAKREYVKVEYCADGTTRNAIVRPREYTIDSLVDDMSEMALLQFYLEIRLMEEKEADLSKSEKKLLTRDTLSYMRLKGSMPAVDLFENILGKTYNNSGSLTDLLYRVKIQEEVVDVLSDT